MLVALVSLGLLLQHAPRSGAWRCSAPVCEVSSLEIIVQRTASGGLGIEVEPESNVVASNAGQPQLALGDLIVAVDGEECGKRYIGALLTPGADTYTFTVQRGTARGREALETVGRRLCIEAADAATVPAIPLVGAGGMSEELSERMLAIVDSLETSGPPTSLTADDLTGFWRLRFTNDKSLEGGMSGFGLIGGCTAVAQFQLYGQPELDSVQCVEVIANQAMGAHQVAALKGTFRAVSDEAQLVDLYTRIELGGAPQSGSGKQEQKLMLTYMGDKLRIVRAGGENGAVRVYEKQSSDVAQGDLQSLMTAPIVKEKVDENRPRWEIADEERRLSGGGPMTDASSIP